uniref:Uncharacterized protein n=1 Tax=Aegilops tauschii subsp. strangulata TaxID=200361 RepID=A0A453JGR0_AEGTS
ATTHPTHSPLAHRPPPPSSVPAALRCSRRTGRRRSSPPRPRPSCLCAVEGLLQARRPTTLCPVQGRLQLPYSAPFKVALKLSSSSPPPPARRRASAKFSEDCVCLPFVQHNQRMAWGQLARRPAVGLLSRAQQLAAQRYTCATIQTHPLSDHVF